MCPLGVGFLEFVIVFVLTLKYVVYMFFSLIIVKACIILMQSLLIILKSTSLNFMQPLKYELGKVIHKYVIIMTLGYAMPRDLAVWFLWRTSRTFRKLVIMNLRAFRNYARDRIDSDVAGGDADYAFLKQVIREKHCLMTLLYRGSLHGWSAADFHSRCDGMGPTLSLFKIKDGARIGGFTTVSWASPANNNQVSVRDDRAELFNLSARRRFPVMKDSSSEAVGHSAIAGPCFGAGELYSRTQ